MVKKEEQKIDWIYPPPGVEEISLWGSLHDGELVSCTSNLSERSVDLEFSVGHLLDDDENATRFLVRMEKASSVRAIAHFPPADEYEDPESIEERETLLREYYAKWREESFSWERFEAALSTDPLLVYEASYVSNDIETTFRLLGALNGEKFNNIFFDVFVRGQKLFASRTDGADFNLQAFIELGRNYWDDFGSRRPN